MSKTITAFRGQSRGPGRCRHWTAHDHLYSPQVFIWRTPLLESEGSCARSKFDSLPEPLYRPESSNQGMLPRNGLRKFALWWTTTYNPAVQRVDIRLFFYKGHPSRAYIRLNDWEISCRLRSFRIQKRVCSPRPVRQWKDLRRRFHLKRIVISGTTGNLFRLGTPYGSPVRSWCQELQDFVLQIPSYENVYF